MFKVSFSTGSERNFHGPSDYTGPPCMFIRYHFQVLKFRLKPLPKVLYVEYSIFLYILNHYHSPDLVSSLLKVAGKVSVYFRVQTQTTTAQCKGNAMH